MPLLLLCGLPCSGKTTVAQKIATFLREQNDKKVDIINDQVFGLEKNTVFADSKKEREARGLLKSAVQRSLSKDTVVIVDSMNYIKGFRYELYCVAKSTPTPHCVVHCDTNLQQCLEWNQNCDPNDQYSTQILEELAQRFESPNSQTRWDSPLFVIQVGDEVPYQQISDALFLRKPPPPNMSTQSQPLSSTNFLYELDRVTQSTIKAILQAQATSVEGDQLTIADVKEKICLNRHLTASELHRHRRQFITYTKMHPVEDTQRLATMFVAYLNTYIT